MKDLSKFTRGFLFPVFGIFLIMKDLSKFTTAFSFLFLGCFGDIFKIDEGSFKV